MKDNVPFDTRNPLLDSYHRQPSHFEETCKIHWRIPLITHGGEAQDLCRAAAFRTIVVIVILNVNVILFPIIFIALIATIPPRFGLRQINVICKDQQVWRTASCVALNKHTGHSKQNTCVVLLLANGKTKCRLSHFPDGWEQSKAKQALWEIKWRANKGQWNIVPQRSQDPENGWTPLTLGRPGDVAVPLYVRFFLLLCLQSTYFYQLIFFTAMPCDHSLESQKKKNQKTYPGLQRNSRVTFWSSIIPTVQSTIDSIEPSLFNSIRFDSIRSTNIYVFRLFIKDSSSFCAWNGGFLPLGDETSLKADRCPGWTTALKGEFHASQGRLSWQNDV